MALFNPQIYIYDWPKKCILPTFPLFAKRIDDIEKGVFITFLSRKQNKFRTFKKIKYHTRVENKKLKRLVLEKTSQKGFVSEKQVF